MVCKNKDTYGFLGPSWVLITYNICPPVTSSRVEPALDGNVKARWDRNMKTKNRSFPFRPRMVQ